MWGVIDTVDTWITASNSTTDNKIMLVKDKMIGYELIKEW